MFVAESALLQAAQDKIITDLTLNENQCQVEMDGQLPATAPQLYVAISPGGMQPGPRHRSSVGAIDVNIAIKVTVYRRVTEVARDRRRSTFLQLLTGIAPTCERVLRALDNSYTLLNAAGAIIADAIADLDPDAPVQLTENETGKFIEPLRSFSPDISPRMVFSDPYDAARMGNTPPADPIIAVARSITFQGARYMQVRASWQPE